MRAKRVWVSRVLTLFILAAAACALAGEEAVAVIDGEYVITADDLEYYYDRALAAGDWPGEEDLEGMLRDVLNSAADGKVLELEAEERGYADEPYFQPSLDGVRSRALRERMWRRVEDAAFVTDADVREFYEKGRKRRKYSFVEAADPARAEEAYRALEAGRLWNEVVAEYSAFKGYGGEGGAWEIPMEYAGDEASEALFALEPGEYSRPVEDADGWAWRIYRFDREVHGSGLSFDEARADIEKTIRARKTREHFDALAAEWREAAPVTRDEERWRRALELPFAEVPDACGGEGVVISDAGGIPVYFDDVFLTVDKMLYRTPEEVDRMREETPYRYEAIWTGVLTRLEGQALLEWRALQEGIDETPSFKREMAARRAESLVDQLYAQEFLPLVREPSPEEIEAYYEGHKEDFYTPERVEVYVVAMPDRGELEAFYGEITAGADLVVAGETRNRDRERAAQDLYEAPPALPPAETEWLGVVAVTDEPAQDETPPGAPSAEELQPRVFPFTELDVLSDVFQLDDGRWAFYKPVYYRPALQRDLEDAEVTYYSRKAVSEEILLSPETAALAEEWLASMRVRHDVVVDEAALAEVVARVRDKPRP